MKKTLLTTSALAGVVFVAGSAFAEAPKVTFSGSTDYYVRMTDYDTPTGGTEPQNGPGWDINQHAVASELIWDANATADNGLQFGANVQLRYAGAAGAVSTDEAWIDFAGSWGRVVLGDDDGVLDNNQVSGASVLPVAAYDTGRFTGSLATPAGWASPTGTNGSVGEASSDVSKIAYYSPSFAGFSVAVSATPDSSSEYGAANTATAVATGATTSYSNILEGTVNYKGDFSGVGVALYAGGAAGEANATLGAARDDLSAWQVGGSVSVAGFSLGLGYGDSDDSGCLTVQSGCESGKFFNAGLAYNFGAGAVGIGYATTFDAKATTAGTEMEARYYSIDASYTIAQGLTGYGGVMFATRDNNAVTNSEADSTVFVLGTRVNF